MNDDALLLDDQHTLNTQNIKNNAIIENSESDSSFKLFDFDSNSVLEQLLCFSPATSVQNSDSDPEYLPSKKTSKTAHASADHPKSTCRRSARLSTFKDENSTNLLSLPLATSEDPEYFPPKGILYALKKSVNDSVPKSDIITNVKLRKQRRSKKFVDPACNNCSGNSHEKLSMSCNKIQPLPDLGKNSSPLSTEQLRQILEDSTFEELSKGNTLKQRGHIDADQEKLRELITHDSKGEADNAKDTKLKMPRTRSSLKLKIKKKDKNANFSISATAKSNKEFNSEDNDTSSQFKVNKDKGLPKAHVQKESKKVLKRRKRQTCRKQFRHKDITLYKLGADPDPVNETAQKNQVIHKIFLRRSSVSTPPLTPHTSKVTKNEEVSEHLLSNGNSDGDKCSESRTVKDSNNLKINSSNCDLNNSNKIYCSSISIENHNMNKVPKVILTPISTKDNYYQKSTMLKDKREVPPQLQIIDEKIQNINSNFKKSFAGLEKSNRNEIGKHNLPIRIPERRTSIAEPLRTPPAPNNKVPSFRTECQSENQLNYMKIEIKNGPSDKEKVLDIIKPKENFTEPSTVVTASIVSKPFHIDSAQSGVQVNNEDLNAKDNYRLPVRNNDTGGIVTNEVVNNLLNVKHTHNRGSSEQAETHKTLFQENQEANTFGGSRNLAIQVVKSCSGITDPLKLHKTNNLPSKKIDSDAKSKINSVTSSKENHGTSHQRTDNLNCSVAQTIYPINELPHKSSSILQQNLLNGPVSKSDVYRNSCHNRGNISMNNFNSELSSQALNSLAISHMRTPHSNTVSSVSKNMPIIEETNQQISNDKVTYETFTSTSPFVTDFSKKNKKGKRKLSRSDGYEEISSKLQRNNNYPNYPSYNYPLSFYSGASPTPPFNPLSPFPLGIPHPAFNMGPPVYQPKPSSCTGQSSTFERTGFRNVAPPPILNPFLSHDPPLPVSTYSSSNTPTSKAYDSRMHYNHFMRFSNPMFMNHNTLPPDYGSIGSNSRRNEALSQNSNSILQQGLDFSSKNFIKSAKKQNPHQIFSPPENTHRRSTEATEPQNTPLALIKTTTSTQYSDWSHIPIASRNEELTITKLPLRENLSKTTSTLTSGQTCDLGKQIEDLTVPSKQSDFRQNDGNTCSIIAVSKSNANITDSTGHPCNKTNAPDRRSGVGSVLHGELANISISIIKNKNEKHKPTKLSQGLLPVLEQAKLVQEEQRISIPQTTKVREINHSNLYSTTLQNMQPIKTSNTQNNDANLGVTTSETNKSISDEKTECRNSSNSKTASPASIYRDIELEINCTKIKKPINNISNQNTNYSNCPPINSKTVPASTCNILYNDTEPELENKIGVTTFNRKVNQNTLALSNSKNIVVENTEPKLENIKSSSLATKLSDTECELDSPSDAYKTAEIINLSIDKPSEVPSGTVVSENETVATSEAVLCSTVTNPKSSNINTIASIMQNIIHQGDVKKFDQYVETIRRSLENRETHKLDAIKQTCSKHFLEKIADSAKISNPEENTNCNSDHDNTASAVPENILTCVNSSESHSDRVSKTATKSEYIGAQAVSLVDSENVTSETVKDLAKTLVPRSSLESEPTNAQVSQNENILVSKNIQYSRNVIDSLGTMSHIHTQVSQTEVRPEHLLNSRVLNLLDSECDVDSERIVTSNKDFVSQYGVASEHANVNISQSVNVTASESIKDSKILNAVACGHINTKASETAAIVKVVSSLDSQNVATYKTTEDSRNVVFSQSVATSKHTNTQNATVTKAAEDSRITVDSQSTVTSQDVNTQVFNSKSVPICESTEIFKNTAVSQVSDHENSQILSSLISENTTQLLAIEIKKELDEEDDDVIIVYDSNKKVATSTEDKGIQADISTLFPLNTNMNYSRTHTSKRKKWKFLEATNYTKVPKICRKRTQGTQKAKAALKSRNRTKCVLYNKQFNKRNVDVIQNAHTCKDEQNLLCIENNRLENTKIKTKNSNNILVTSSTKLCHAIKSSQATCSKLSDDVSQMPKTVTTASTKPCQTDNNKLFDNSSQVSKTLNATITKPCQTTSNKLSGNNSQISKTLTAVSSKLSKTANKKLSGDSSQLPKTSTAGSIKPCQNANNILFDVDSKMSKTSTITSTKPCQTVNKKFSHNSYKKSNKNSQKSIVNKRSSKRLLLKHSMKAYTNKDAESHRTYSKPGNAQLFSSSKEESSSESEKLKHSQSCVFAPPMLQLLTSQNIKNNNYTLQNSEIIQTRCFVRLSRILENSNTSNNQTNDSNVSIDTGEEKAVTKVCNVPVLNNQPTGNLIKKTQEAQPLGETLSKTSDSQAVNYRYTSSKNEITNNSSQELQTSSSLSIASSHKFDAPLFISKCANNSNPTGNLVEILENTSSHTLPATNKVTIAIQMPQKLLSPNKTSHQIIDSVIQIPQKSPAMKKILQQTLTSPSHVTVNESVEIPQKSLSLNKMSLQIAKISPTDLKNQKDHTTNSAVQTPPNSPSALFSKKSSSSLPDTYKRDGTGSNHLTSNSVQIPQKSSSISKSSTQVVSSSPTTARSNNCKNSVQLSQNMLTRNKLSKQISIPSPETCPVGSNDDNSVNNSVQKLQQLPRLRETSFETSNTLPAGGARNDNEVEKHSVQELTKLAPLRKLSNQTQSSSPDSSIQTPQKTSPSKIANVPFFKSVNTGDKTINDSVQLLNNPPTLPESLKPTSYSSENNYHEADNYNVHMTQQSSLGRTFPHISDISTTTYKDANNSTHTTSKLAQIPQQSSSLIRTSPHIVETSIEKNSDNIVNNLIQVPQQSHSLSKITELFLKSSTNTSKSANNYNQVTNNTIEIPQKSPSVIKTSLGISNVTNNLMPISKESFSSTTFLRSSNINNNSIEIPQKTLSSTKTLPDGSNIYNSIKIQKDSLVVMLPSSSNTVMCSVEMSQNSQSFTKTPHQGSNTAINPVTIPEKSPSTSRISPQIPTNNSVKTPQNSPSLSRTSSQDSNTSLATYKCINTEQATNRSVDVSKKSPSTGNTLQQTFSVPTDFYRYGNRSYQNGNNTTNLLHQPPSCTQLSPQFASPSSANNNCVQTSQKTASVGRTSYQISKTPPIAHRRSNNTNQSTRLQPPLLNTASSQVINAPSDTYTGSRNMQFEIDLTISSKSTSREDVNNRLVSTTDRKTPDLKTSKRSHSKYENEDQCKVVSSNAVANTYQPYIPFHAESVPFRLYPSYPQNSNDDRPRNEFAKKIQGNFTEHSPVSFPTNQEMRQNSYSSSSSSNSQFSPTFRQPSPMLNKLYTKIVNSKQATEAKNNDLRNTNVALRQHVSYNSDQLLENFCETQQSQSSGTKPAFKDLKEKYETLNKSIESGNRRSPETNLRGNLHKNQSKQDENYLNLKAPDAHHFNGNLSPDYGYFSPLTKNAPPNFESIVYRPNPIRYNESNSFHNIKYRGIATASQHTPLSTRETYHHANAALPIQNNGSNSNSTYIRQNSKLPPNSATLPMANGVQHKVQQPDVDKISSILPKLQQSETLNPEQYVLEMSVLEKDGCPRPFLEFYSFVTKKQIASNQLPISFRIFLEFHNAGKLKNFENAFRVYSERHEKEKKTILKST